MSAILGSWLNKRKFDISSTKPRSCHPDRVKRGWISNKPRNKRSLKYVAFGARTPFRDDKYVKLQYYLLYRTHGLITTIRLLHHEQHTAQVHNNQRRHPAYWQCKKTLRTAQSRRKLHRRWILQPRLHNAQALAQRSVKRIWRAGMGTHREIESIALLQRA